MCLIKSIITLYVCVVVYNAAGQGVIVDHRHTDISKLSDKDIQAAKGKFKIVYGHTSHGSQIISGLQALANKDKRFSINRTGSNNALSIWDRKPAGDLGNPNRYAWANRTRQLLKGTDGKTRNMVIWSWCGQVSTARERDIKLYLDLMTQLEDQFPDVTFVYMTGHLDGSGIHGNLHTRNEQIRDYCKKNKKVLFDFADIESYDPDGEGYLVQYARDNCEYRYNGVKRNWAVEWLKNNPDHDYALPEKAAHTHVLNSALKANAFWWMLAKLSKGNSEPDFQQVKTVTADIIEPEQVISKGEVAKEIEPEPSEVAVAKFAKLWRFDKPSDYRDWKESGTDDSLIPEKDKGILIPASGTPAVALLRTKLAVKELEFKAKLLSGNHINWYINSDWVENDWKINDGVGGVFKPSGCYLVVDGNVHKIPNSPKLDPDDRSSYHMQVTIVKDKLIWGINGRVIVEAKLSPELIGQIGQVAIGAYKSKLLISGIYISGTK